MQRIATCLMFVGEQCGRAEEAMGLYVGAFEDARVDEVTRDEAGEGTHIKQARFTLAGRPFVAMDSAAPHQFTFTPAISLFVDMEDPGELDAAFATLAEGGSVLMPLQAYPFSPRFGWLQDRYGISWQLTLPTTL